MTPTREDIQLYVSGNFDGDVAALERAIAENPALAAALADEAKLELALREAGAAAAFCPACADLVRGARCDTCGAAVAPGGYVVERVLVSNAHGRMYGARDVDGRRVALKELAFVQAPNAAATEAFEREAKLLRALDHAAIPRFVASFEEGLGVHTRYYLAQELVDGRALDADLAEHFWREDEVIALTRDVLGVLAYLQALSPLVVHRDVKPANIIRRADGSIALVDFGAAHVTGATQGSTTIGTFGYMPVEQLAGLVDATTDVYALAMSLVHLLTRQEPWKILQAPDLVMNVSAPLRAWLAKATHADPKQRFPHAKAALEALDARDRIAVPRKLRRSPILLGAVAAGALAVGAGGFAAVKHFAVSSRDDATATSGGSAASGTFALALYSERGSVTVELDGKPIVGTLRDGDKLEVTPGWHHLVLAAAFGRRCDRYEMASAGKVLQVECDLRMARVPPAEVLPRGEPVGFSASDAKLHEVLRKLGDSCRWNIVVPESLDPVIPLAMSAGVACGDELEQLLAQFGLWYVYRSDGRVIRVAEREVLDREHEDAIARAKVRDLLGLADDVLPEADGPYIDFEIKGASLRDAVQTITGVAHLSLLLPKGVDPRITATAKHVKWTVALQEILAAHGLWYRYHPDGRVLRIATRDQLDREDEDELARRRGP
jgi:hypothetical protein